MTSSFRKRRLALVGIAICIVGFGLASLMRGKSDVAQEVAPTEILTPPATDASSQSQVSSANEEVNSATESTGNEGKQASAEIPLTRESSIKEVLELASTARKKMESMLGDYKARFTKQERGEDGQLGEQSEIQLKVQTTLRNETNDAPMRIYLKFVTPKANAGREIIWAEDLYDAQMAVHETSLLLSWKTLWLDPTGMLAMAGQKYPVYEIGLVKLVEKLLERGKADLGNPDVSVTITRNHVFDSADCELIRVTRTKPGGGEDDFSLAEIIYDPERWLILSYRSFGWPEDGNGESETPLLESYQYRDLEVNVGLTEKDFDINHSEYGYP